MRRRLLVYHFLSQFVENDFAPETDRHQVLALAAAALVTLPLFTTVFMSVKYLMQPLQTPAWTQATATGDEMIFCAASMLVSAIIATLEWDAVGLSPRDAVILGVLPVTDRDVLRAKVTSLLAFAAAFVISLNTLPALLHPTVMVANLTLNPLMVVPLMAAHALSTAAAGAFGFASVLTIRESLNLVFRRRRFERLSGLVRSGLLLSLLLLLLLAPGRLSESGGWILEGSAGPILQRPVAWFAAMHAVIASRVLDAVPRPDLPAWRADEDDRLVSQHRRSLPDLAARASRGAGLLLVLLIACSSMYFRNARRLRLLAEEPDAGSGFRFTAVGDVLAKALARRPATRAGLLFLVRTALRSPVHRMYLIAAVATGGALLIGLEPALPRGAGTPVRAYQLAAQTLMLTALAAGFRAAIRTSADARSTWLFGVADTGNIVAFRKGVRVGLLTVAVALVLLLVPLYAAAWGVRIASLHAINGAVLAFLLVEVACGNVEQPLIRTIPPNDALNTVGAVFLGAIVIFVFMLARIERVALASGLASVVFAVVILFVGMCVHGLHERDHRAASSAASLSVD